MAVEPAGGGGGSDSETRRDFLGIVAWSGLGIGALAFAWPLINSMNPSADVLALSSISVDISGIEEGSGVTVMWRGKPVFLRRRTAEEIVAAEETDLSALRDPQPDAERVQRPEWLVLIGVCPHLGCVPGGTKPTQPRGEWGGWFCACHGSQFDTSGRIRKGPSPTNMVVPPYSFESDTRIMIG